MQAFKLIKPRNILLIGILVTIISCTKQSSPLQKILENIPGTTVNKLEGDSVFSEKYEIYYTQSINHNKREGEKFQQRVIIGHKDFNKPMVVQLEGYSIYSDKACELTNILDANQITIEHRFFKDSKPDSIPWQYLNIKQAASDQHKIIKSLKKYYKNKWISTGISKGGQATIYHRRFYPFDVDISVPYVAPLNFSNEDTRIYDFFETVGTKKERNHIYDFQLFLFENKDKILPLLKSYAKEKNYKFSIGIERAYDLNVLEFPFAFWQWGSCCKKIPKLNSDLKDIFDYWKLAAPFSFFEDTGIKNNRPFFFQAMTELGMYGYNITPFKKYLDDTENIKFDFTMPKNVSYSYNPDAMKDINNWLQTNGNNILYIYGENDPWGATSINLSGNTNAVKMVNPGGSHKTRINSFPPKMQDSIYHVLEKWLEISIIESNGGTKEKVPLQVL